MLTIFFFWHVEDADHVDVHPAEFDVRRHQLEVGEHVRHVGVLARRAKRTGPRRLCEPWASRIAAVWCVRVSMTVTLGADRIGVQPVVGQMVGHEHRLAVRRDGRRDRFAHGLDAGHLGTGRQVDHRHVVVEPVADVQPLAVRARWPGPSPCARPGSRPAIRPVAASSTSTVLCGAAQVTISLRPVRGQDQAASVRRARRRRRVTRPAGEFDPGDLSRIGVGDVAGLAVLGDHDRTRPQVVLRGPVRAAGQRHQSAKHQHPAAESPLV